MKILRKALRIPVVLARIVFLNPFSLIYIYLVSPLVIKILPTYLKYYVKAKIMIQKYCYLNKEIKHWRQNKEEILKVGKTGYITKIEDLGLSKEKFEFLKKTQRNSPEVIIGEFDQDGFLLSNFGEIQDIPMIDKNKFMVRKGLKLIFASMLISWIVILGCLLFVKVNVEKVDYNLETAEIGDTIHYAIIPERYTTEETPVGLIVSFQYLIWLYGFGL